MDDGSNTDPHTGRPKFRLVEQAERVRSQPSVVFTRLTAERAKRTRRALFFLLVAIPFSPWLQPGHYIGRRDWHDPQTGLLAFFIVLGIGLVLSSFIGRGVGFGRQALEEGAELQLVTDRPQLIMSGIYRWIRNPFYLGGAVLAICWSIWQESSVAFLGALTLVAVLREKALVEEWELAEQLGDRYRVYCTRTGRFFPRLNFKKSRD